MSNLQIDVYDLTGREYCYRYTDSTSVLSDTPNTGRLLDDDNNRLGSRRLDNLLIYPRNEKSNREPYLQDFKYPILDDFILENGDYDFSNSKFLSEILDDIDSSKSNEALWHLKKYFAAQTAINDLKLSKCNNENRRIVLLVPDRYSPLTQEKLLVASDLKRDETFLLWRSVAACLGAEDFLREKKAKEGDNVAIIDIQQKETSVSILTLKQDGDYLVPKRRAFTQEGRNLFYPINKKISRIHYDRSRYTPFEINFYDYIYGRLKKEVFLPQKNGEWKKKHIAARYKPDFISLRRSDINFFIIVGDNPTLSFDIPSMNEFNTLNEMTLRKLEENRKFSFVAEGAAKFCVRKENNLPTYFDECQELSIVVNDERTENVAPRVLIKARKDCRGGEKIVGEEISDISLLQGTKSAKFYLCLGNADQTAKLKYLEQEFTEEIAPSTQKLSLKPIMVPGQGLAEVSVQCLPIKGEKPLFEDEVFLNWLAMEDTNETIASLNEKTDRTFPPDIPEVHASYEKWLCVKEYVQRYLVKGTIDPGLFSKAQWLTNGTGKTAKLLGRENVFGIGRSSLPPFEDKEIFNALFNKLSIDFERYNNKNSPKAEDFLRLIAWTYQRENRVFDNVKKNVIFEIKRAAKYPEQYKLKPQFYTFCANFLHETNDIELFFDLFLERMAKTQERPLNWCRSLGSIMMFNNTMLDDIPTKKCRICMKNLCILYKGNEEREQLPKPILRAILFLLRKRRYDRNFCKKDSPVEDDVRLFKTLLEITDTKNSRHQNLLDAIKGYLIGKGGFLPIADLTDD